MEKATSSLKDLFMLPFWKKLYKMMGNQSMFSLLTENILYYQLSPTQRIQLTGPAFQKNSLPNKTPSFSLSSIYYHLSFPRYPGFPKTHLLSRLYSLNQAINRIEINSPPSAFTYKTIRNDVVLILVHQIFKKCYSKWKNLSFEEEIRDLKIRYHIQMGEWTRKRVPFPPRLQSCKIELAKFLYNTFHCSFAHLIQIHTPLPDEYVEYKTQWK